MTLSTHLPIIMAKHLTIGYQKKVILNNFTAHIEPGEFIVILGPNGSGKTTLLKTLLGLLKPIEGTLKILDCGPHQNCSRIGYMPQQLLRPELQHLTARTLLTAAIQARQWGLPHLNYKQQQNITHALEQVDALSFSDTAFYNCSGGQQRRIMLAQALLGQPKILLLDEPLANLDFKQQEIFIEILNKLSKEQQVTILMTSHDINPLTQVVSRILYLANGQALFDHFDKILTSEKLTELYQTPIEVIRHHQRYFVVHRDTGHLENTCCEHI